ncbi:hypothetical protein HDC34_001541 [Pseudoclavibacter sp. JAI123]|uniref:hypothetical protein n=1 Tax=Pseudoclavibacter sp. JAI123 TaxID=2723065 RepID=UPI00182473B2|nr:hypothetical protein [Pseudoclavibacter sp. JAI123]NYF13247.1 hypothetical protein [Pseudoclavibacter sp. JAI123]
MSKRRSRSKAPELDSRCFVQVRSQPSLGVETSTGTTWVGVDQQVGHGSADALFELTAEQYVGELVWDSVKPGFVGECWSGKHDDLRLFDPRGGSWYPEQWVPARTRMFPPRVDGEIWHHVDALGEAPDSERATVSRALAGGTEDVTVDAGRVAGIRFTLRGDPAYPRPAGLIAGLGAGASRAQVSAVLGASIEADSDVHGLEGDRVRLGYEAEGLAEVILERPAAQPVPDGPMRLLLEMLGEPEGGFAWTRGVELLGEVRRRWAVSSGFPRHLLEFDCGAEVQVEDARVLSVRLRPSPEVDTEPWAAETPPVRSPRWPGTRDETRRAFGAPLATTGRMELRRFGTCDLMTEYSSHEADAAVTELTALPTGVSVSHRIHRWRSGEFTMFLDALGQPEAHPLVLAVGRLDGVDLSFRDGRLERVEIGGAVSRAERFAAFVDGTPARPTREELPFGVPTYIGEHDDLRDFEQGWIHVHARDGVHITTIAVSLEQPEDIDVHLWLPHRDR